MMKKVFKTAIVLSMTLWQMQQGWQMQNQQEAYVRQMQEQSWQQMQDRNQRTIQDSLDRVNAEIEKQNEITRRSWENDDE